MCTRTPLLRLHPTSYIVPFQRKAKTYITSIHIHTPLHTHTIASSCREVRSSLASHSVPLGKFIITKQLTKKLEEYPDARNQPHVQVQSTYTCQCF
jgi:DNA polymerase elongation subunit (family B)